MPRGHLPNVERWRDRHGKMRFYFRRGKGARTPLPGHPSSDEFEAAYSAALAGHVEAKRGRSGADQPASLAALIKSYLRSPAFLNLRKTTKKGYLSRLEVLRAAHGHRSVGGLSKERIEQIVMAPLADRPAAALDTLKKLRVLIRHARSLDPTNCLRLQHDPSAGIKRPKISEIRAWTKTETDSFEARWPLGTKQRTAFALMLYVGTARVDVHRMTWAQLDSDAIGYVRNKTGVGVELDIHRELHKALVAAPRQHVTIVNTEYGRPFTVDGFSRFMRDAIRAAGLPLDCKPHGLRKTLGKRLAEAGATAHEIMAALGHTTLSEAERYTREADRRRGGRAAVRKLEAATNAGGT
jgi:integrase